MSVAGAMRGGAGSEQLRPLWWWDMRRRMPAAWQREWDDKLRDELAFSAPLFDRIDFTPWRSDAPES